jgi:signal transduction histidine kinase
MTTPDDDPGRVTEATVSSAAFAAAFATLPTAAAIIAPDKRVVIMNDALALMCGLQPGDTRPIRVAQLAGLLELRDEDGSLFPDGSSPLVVAAAGGRIGESPMIARTVGTSEARPVLCAVVPIDDGASWRGALLTIRDRSGAGADQQALEEAQAALRVLVADRERVQAEERRRIARDLHDDLQQSLAALNMRLGMAESALDPDATEARRWLEESQRNVIDAAGATRRIIDDLRPQGLYHRPLLGALRDLTEAFRTRTGVACDFTAEPESMHEPPEEIADCIYRIAQESLTNVAKHADATAVRMRLEFTPAGPARFTVIDDGRGLDVPTAQHRVGSYGLLGMSERVRALNGHMRVTGAPGRGTTVEVEIPLGASAEGHV